MAKQQTTQPNNKYLQSIQRKYQKWKEFKLKFPKFKKFADPINPMSPTSDLSTLPSEGTQSTHGSLDDQMSRPVRFDIVFASTEALYFSEQVVSGNVVLEIKEPINLKGVKMRFKGECSFHFSDRKQIIRKRKHAKKKCFAEFTNNTYTPPNVQNTWNNRDCNGVGFTNPAYVNEIDAYKWDRTPESPVKNATNNNPKQQTMPISSETVNDYEIIQEPRQHFRAMETYFDCEFYIYGHRYQGAAKELLPSGTHLFPFAFNLPPNLPSSFSSEKGIIRYMAAAVLDRPAADNLVRKAGFTVISVLDLNLTPHCTDSVRRSKAKNLCGLFCDTGPISLSLCIPRRGYVSGETMHVFAEVDNISGRKTKRTRLTFLQEIYFVMPNDIKKHKERRVIREIVRGSLQPGESDFWQDVTLLIPPLAANNIHLTCRLMKLSYSVEMAVELHAPWEDLVVSIPINIGNVPHVNFFPTFLPPSETNSNGPKIPRITHLNLPPFSYSNCFFGITCLEKQYESITGDQEHMGPPYVPQTPYCPIYPMYTTGNNVSRTTSSTSCGTISLKTPE